MHSSGINAHKLGCHLHKKLYSIMFTDNQAEGGGAMRTIKSPGQNLGVCQIGVYKHLTK